MYDTPMWLTFAQGTCKEVLACPDDSWVDNRGSFHDTCMAASSRGTVEASSDHLDPWEPCAVPEGVPGWSLAWVVAAVAAAVVAESGMMIRGPQGPLFHHRTSVFHSVVDPAVAVSAVVVAVAASHHAHRLRASSLHLKHNHRTQLI